jgi:hypothetical protein
MKDHAQAKVWELVVNLDEVESAEWEDQKPEKVNLPISGSEKDIYHLVSRKFEHLSLLTYGSIAGDSLTPRVLTADPIPDSLWSNGLRPGEEAMIHHCSLPYIDEFAFFEYLTQALIPYVNSVRINPDLASEYAVVLMSFCISAGFYELPIVEERGLWSKEFHSE